MALRWEDVRDAPTFGELWPTLRAWIDDAKFIAAHNASFDRDVLGACCATSGVRAPRLPFTCTVRLARAHGDSTQPRCQTSAATFALHCVTMTRNPMRRRVRASYSRPKLRAGTCARIA